MATLYLNTMMGSRAAQIELHIAVLLFGISGLFGKLVSASPAMIVFGRTAFAAVTIFVTLRLCSLSLDKGGKKGVALMALSGFVLAFHWLTFFHSIQLSTVAIGLVGYATFPIFVTFIEPLFFRQKIRGIDLLSALLVTGGLILVAPSFDLNDSGTIGLLWAVFSGALFAILTLMNRKIVRGYSFGTITFYQHGFAALCVAPWIFKNEAAPSIQTVLLLLLLGVLCTALPQALFIKSLKTIKAQLASIVAGLEPIYGIILGAAFLHETPTVLTITGAFVVFAAVFLAMKAHGEADPAKR